MTDICNMYTNLKNKHHITHLYKREIVLNMKETFSSFYLQPNLPIPSSLQQLLYLVIEIVKTYLTDIKKKMKSCSNYAK